MRRRQRLEQCTKSEYQWRSISAVTALLITMLIAILAIYGSSSARELTETEVLEEPVEPNQGKNPYEMNELNPNTKVQQLRLDLSKWSYGNVIRIEGMLTFCDWGVQNYTLHLVKSVEEFVGLKINIYHVGDSMVKLYDIRDWFSYVTVSHDVGSETTKQTYFPLDIGHQTSQRDWVESSQLDAVKDQLHGYTAELIRDAQSRPMKVASVDFRLGIRRQASHFAVSINGFPLPILSFDQFDTDFNWLAFISSDSTDSLQPYCNHWDITEATVEESPKIHEPVKYEIMDEKEFKRAKITLQKHDWEVQVHGRVKPAKSKSLQTLALQNSAGADLGVFTFGEDGNTATIRSSNKWHKAEMVRQNKKNYYESYPKDPFVPGSDFVVAIRCEPNHLQVSVSVGRRLVTWHINKIPDPSVAQLVASGDLDVTKTIFLVPEMLPIQSRLVKGTYLKSSAKKVFDDKCHTPREIQLQGTVPSISMNRELVSNAIEFDVRVSESSSADGDEANSMDIKFYVDQFHSAVVQINDRVVQELSNVLKPGYDYSISITPKATHFEIMAYVLDKHALCRIKYQGMDSLVDLYQVNGALNMKNLSVIDLPDFSMDNSELLSDFFNVPVHIADDLKNKNWEISIEGKVQPLASASSIKQEFRLYDGKNEVMFYFNSVLHRSESFVGMAKTVLNILPGLSPAKKWREADYYQTFGVSPFKENSGFLLGILRMGKTIQISVTVDCRLVTWEVALESDPVAFSLSGDLVTSSLRGFITAVDVLKL